MTIEPIIRNAGQFKFIVNQIEPIQDLQGFWMTEFDDYAEAVKYTYPHREQELKAYWNWIMQMFNLSNPLNHRAVIRFDQWFRRQLENDPQLTFYDSQSFTSNLLLLRLFEESEEDNANICRRYNAGKRHSRCKYNHVCSKCCGEHRQFECPRD